MKKILFLGPQDVQSNNDGGKKSIFGSITAFSKYFEVYYVFPTNENNIDVSKYFCNNIIPIYFKLDTADNIRVYFKSLFTSVPFKFFKYYSSQLSELLINTINNNNIKIVILNHSHMGVYFNDIISNTDAKVYLREHNIEYKLVEMFYVTTNNIFFKLISYHQYLKTKKYEINLWQKVQKTFFISDSDYIIASEYNKNILCVYDGIEGDLLQNNINIGTYLLFSGSLKTIQNLVSLKWFLHNIWHKLPPSIINHYPLYITGTEREVIKNLLNKHDEYFEQYNIHLKGFVDNYEDVLNNSFALISPTVIGSGVRIKVIEAMKMKKLVFCSKIDIDMLSGIVDCENSIEVTNYNDFISKLKYVENNDYYVQIVENAYLYVTNELTWNNHIQKISRELN